MLFYYLLSIILIITIVIIYSRLLFKNKSLDKINSDPGIPFFGHVFKFGKQNENLVKVLEEMWIKYKRDKFVLKIGPFHQVVLTKPDDVATVLLSKENVEKNIFYTSFTQMFGDSSLTYPKEKWQILRKIVSPAFSYGLLNHYVAILKDEAIGLNTILNNFKCEDVDIYSILYQCILRASCRNVLGFEIKSNVSFGRYLESIDVLLGLSTSRVFSSWKIITPIYKLTSEAKKFESHKKIIRTMNKRILEMKSKEFKDIIEKVNAGKEDVETLLEDEEFIKQKISFVHLLLLGRYPNGESLTTNEMINEMHVFVVAGFETSVAVTSFGLFCLAMNPEIQEIALSEQLSITGGDLTKEITYKDITEMIFLELVIKETMRIFTPAPFFGRILSEPIVLSDGIELPAGTNIMFLPYLTHKDPEYFSNPEEFRPSRFTESLKNPYAYFPFSLGPRNCVGQKLGMMQAKFFLATILRSYRLLPPLGEKPKLIVNPLLRSATGINIRLQKRN